MANRHINNSDTCVDNKSIDMIPILFLMTLIFEAHWDASAFADGDSNHLWKTLFIGSWLAAAYFTKYVYNWKLYIIVVMIYITMRYGVFDLILNHIRILDYDYKTGAVVLKTLSMIICVGLIITYYKVSDIYRSKKVIIKN